MRTVFVILIVALLTGCGPTPYQPATDVARFVKWGGYKDAHLQNNIYYVEVDLNGYSKQIMAVQYLYRRAKEVCVENGYQDYRVYNEKDLTAIRPNWGGLYVEYFIYPACSCYVECLPPKK
jgi:hypothetical protein